MEEPRDRGEQVRRLLRRERDWVSGPDVRSDWSSDSGGSFRGSGAHSISTTKPAARRERTQERAPPDQRFAEDAEEERRGGVGGRWLVSLMTCSVCTCLYKQHRDAWR